MASESSTHLSNELSADIAAPFASHSQDKAASGCTCLLKNFHFNAETIQMNTKQFSRAVALCALGFTGMAKAETYEGVLAIQSHRSRSEVAMEAREAARNPIAGEASFAENVYVSRGQLARTDVRRAAVSIARAGNPYGDHAGAGVLTVRGNSVADQTVETQARKTPAATHDSRSGN